MPTRLSLSGSAVPSKSRSVPLCRRFALPPTILQRAQRFHVFEIFAQLFSFRCLENFWNSSKSPVAHDEAKCVEPNLAFADVLVSIDPRTTPGFRVVQVLRDKMLQPNCAVEFLKHFPRSCFTR